LVNRPIRELQDSPCGTQFGEWADGGYYDTVETEIPSPLAFQVDMAGSKDAVVELTVHVPGYEVP
jgi:hypothetical protein